MYAMSCMKWLLSKNISSVCWRCSLYVFIATKPLSCIRVGFILRSIWHAVNWEKWVNWNSELNRIELQRRRRRRHIKTEMTKEKQIKRELFCGIDEGECINFNMVYTYTKFLFFKCLRAKNMRGGSFLTKFTTFKPTDQPTDTHTHTAHRHTVHLALVRNQ